MTNNSLNLALQRASKELSIDLKTVTKVYRSFWKFIRNSIEALPLETISEEDFNNTDHNFNITYIGKLNVDYERVVRRNIQQQEKNAKNKKD